AGDEARLAQFEQSLDSLRLRFKIPGLSAAIVHNRQIIWDKGFGFQDIAGGILATPDTPYRIASLTKTFASTLVMRCVEQNNLDLNSPIINYTSSITQSGVRIRHVFTHTSESVPPGESFRYNGNRFGALTPVVESCAGKPFREILAKTILDPLEMWDSVPGQDMENPTPAVAALFTPETLQRYSRVIQRLAKPYTIDNRGRPVLSAYPNRGINASAGLISTVRDLARYDAAIDRHQLLRPETQEVAWTNHINSRGQVLPYAKGWFVQNRFGTRLVWHYGFWPTFSSLILKVPSRNITLILFANSDGLSAPFSNALGGVGDVTGSQFANLFLQMLDDPEAFRGNPIDGEEFFVRQHYRDFLGREPDDAGLAFWIGEIARCGVDSQCREASRVNVSAAFFLSIEFQQTGYLVYRAHQTAFNIGERLKLSTFLIDTQTIGRDVVVGRAGWEQQLEQNKQDFFRGFASRPEFLAAYPEALSAAQFIDALDANTGFSLSQHERADLTGRLNAGALDRAQALRAIAEGANFQRREFNRAFVLMQYFGYLRRNPDDAPDTDLLGYNFWLNKLNDHDGNFKSAEMVKAFIASPEYQQRFVQ
ncbi:MAG: serine hydrolase, partial [Rubrivivax sp.]|nr:serine hydrolase [Pyrinomonadaceae bacterium]